MTLIFTRLFPVVAISAAIALGSGCAHKVAITSVPSGADVYVAGAKVGTTPMTYEEKGQGPGATELVLKHSGKEKKVLVERSKLDAGAIGAGAGIGAGACLGLTCVASVLSVGSAVTGVPFCLPCVPLGFCGGLLFIPAGAAGAWYLFGSTMPDTVAIDMNKADGAAVTTTVDPKAGTVVPPIVDPTLKPAPAPDAKPNAKPAPKSLRY